VHDDLVALAVARGLKRAGVATDGDVASFVGRGRGFPDGAKIPFIVRGR
jgi:hypothetical protein